MQRFELGFDSLKLLCGYLAARWVEWNDIQRPADRSHQPILDMIWPDWLMREKERAIRTLEHAARASTVSSLTPDTLRSFVDFLGDNRLEAFFWRLRSFEAHAFALTDFALEGMKADLQGLAICVEHITSALGGSGDQLYGKFKSIWQDESVKAILKREMTSRAWHAKRA